ncbi:hypothetical protein FHS29_004705 [Saccharothrix tamanrassetensis]|uniref:Uncharacterized protein n=1 Tax=Saccharothrix tamanrassetensis TaxID=1051531 RepID=A0A841CPU6_9PSEU|nr:hypothetical protein [Saccharothrix tamanrassetensis]MBB5958097.1 hypothetical protein [Saccharothrix tamanrassetensis]
MTDAPLAADALDPFASGFADVAAEFADETGGPPTLGEFLEVLGWSVPTNSDAVDGTFTEPLRLTATVKGKRYRPEGASRVAELNDHVFEDARSLNATLTERIASAGSPSTPQQYASAILRIIRTGRIAFADVDGTEVRRLVAERAKRNTRLSPGDILAIPVEPSGHRLAVVITRNRFGTAIGLFEGVSPDGRPSADVLKAPRRFPVYTEESQVKNGTWQVVGHDEGLLGRFPADPEVYHKPGAYPGVDTGEHGAAETADGPLRMIDAEEAEAVGLAAGRYRQTYPAVFLQKVLSGERD